MEEPLGTVRGDVDAAIADDFPGLALWAIWTMVPAGTRPEGRDRLKGLDDRVRDASTGGFRRHPVTACYRAFSRQVGLDPDVRLTPVEALARDRLLAGSYPSRGPLRDALAVAMLETGVPLWTVDADAVHGWLSVSVTDDSGLVVRDERRPLAPLLLEPSDAPSEAAGGRAVVYTLRLGRAVPDATVEEAFWHVRSCLTP